MPFTLYSVYLRGEAYVTVRQSSAASAEFQKILDHPGVVLNGPIGALAHLGLGRAYAITGDDANATRCISRLPRPLERAEPDIPTLKQAKAEYEKLQ